MFFLFNVFKKKVEHIVEEAKTFEMEEVLDADKGKKIKDKQLDDLLWELEVGLLESDVAQEVATSIIEDVRKELLDLRLKKGVDIGEAVETALRHAIKKALETQTMDFDKFIREHEKPVVVMFIGVNGSGKTTAIAKIAYRLQKQKITTVLAAGDTFRAGAIEQLQRHAEKLGVRMIKHRAGADPAAVAYDAIEHAKARHRDVVLLDTAGRMQTNSNLMDEMAKIGRVANPDLVIFVGDSLAGNDAVEQAVRFNHAVNIDAVILTKIDADAKGGAALSIARSIGKPIIFVSTGQEYGQLEKFDPEWMTSRLFE
ncbi:MAG: signal recognition particle-docking protein FtsY [Candidatus Thermoplasmatota archaeon]|nr:signal recognition particle-docking protein FtsY [Candidatus Thermoplasmatota archaeon]